jgi:hypothetical protein
MQLHVEPDFDLTTDMQQLNDAAELPDPDFEDTRPPALERRDLDERVYLYGRRLNRHRAELEAIKKLLSANIETTVANSEQTAKVLEIVTLGRNFFKVLGWVGAQIGPLAAIVALFYAIYLFAKTGKWELKI